MDKENKIILTPDIDDETEIKALRQIIADEERKGDLMDADLVEESVSYLEELTGDAVELSDADIKNELDNILAKVRTAKVITQKPKRKLNIKIAVAAALISALMFSMAIATVAFDDLTYYFSRVIKEGSFAVGKGEFKNDGISEIFDTPEALAWEKNISFLSPSKLPDGIKVDEVVYSESDGNIKIDFGFSDISYAFSILVSSDMTPEIYSYKGILEYNGIKYYYNPEKPETAFAYDNGIYYTVNAPDAEQLEAILHGMEVLK